MEQLRWLATKFALLINLGLLVGIASPVAAASKQKFIPVPNYAIVTVTWRSSSFPLLEETLDIRKKGETLCNQAIPAYSKKYPKKGYELHQTLQSPDLKTIGQFVSGKIFVSKFVYGCYGVLIRID